MSARGAAACWLQLRPGSVVPGRWIPASGAAQLTRIAAAGMLILVGVGRTAAAQDGDWGSVHLVEELRIGTFDGPDETIFGRISYLVAGENGTIYVADGQLETLRAYDADGAYLRTIGRKGEAPGEYLEIDGMTMLPNGNLAIYDARNQRITLFHPDGSVVRNFRISNPMFTSDMLFHDLQGNLYLRSSDPGEPTPGHFPLLLLKLSPEGEVTDRIPVPERQSNSFMLFSPEGPQTIGGAGPLWTWSPMAYVVVGHSDEYVLELRGSDMQPRRIQRTFDPVAVLPEERKQWEAWARFFNEQHMKIGRPTVNYAIPDRKAAFKAIEASDDGMIWVLRHVPTTKRDVTPRPPGDERPLTPWRESQAYDVFDPEGRFLANITVPRDARIVFRRGRHAWGVASDDTGEHVVRFRIESGP